MNEYLKVNEYIEVQFLLLKVHSLTMRTEVKVWSVLAAMGDLSDHVSMILLTSYVITLYL